MCCVKPQCTSHAVHLWYESADTFPPQLTTPICSWLCGITLDISRYLIIDKRITQLGDFRSWAEDMPFKVNDSSIVILKSLLVLRCNQCGDTELLIGARGPVFWVESHSLWGLGGKVLFTQTNRRAHERSPRLCGHGGYSIPLASEHFRYDRNPAKNRDQISRLMLPLLH